MVNVMEHLPPFETSGQHSRCQTGYVLVHSSLFPGVQCTIHSLMKVNARVMEISLAQASWYQLSPVHSSYMYSPFHMAT